MTESSGLSSMSRSLEAGLHHFHHGIDADLRGLSPVEEVERVSKAPLIHQPGTFWEYSIATDLLGRVVEAASGKRLADFLDERLFRPLGRQAEAPD